MKDPTDSIEPLIAALREELQHYGEMLALLDRQQEQVKARSAGEIFQSISLIQAQAAAIQGARQHREKCRAAAALACRQPRKRAVRRFDPAPAARLPAAAAGLGG